MEKDQKIEKDQLADLNGHAVWRHKFRQSNVMLRCVVRQEILRQLQDQPNVFLQMPISRAFPREQWVQPNLKPSRCSTANPEKWFLVEHYDFRVHIVMPSLGLSSVVKKLHRRVVDK